VDADEAGVFVAAEVTEELIRSGVSV